MIPRIAYLVAAIAALGGACTGRPGSFGEAPDVGADSALRQDADTGDGGRSLAAVGEVCNGPETCAEMNLCIGADNGAFVCMRRCSTAYSLCPDGGVCLPVMSNDAAVCYIGGTAADTEACQNNLQCGPGLLCVGSDGERYCRAACAGPTNCPANDYCLTLDSGAGLCRSATGAACNVDGDCQPGLTCSVSLADVASSFPSGYCTSACQTDADCRANSVCRELPGTTTAVCLQRCAHRSDCRYGAGYDCLQADSCTTSTDPDACQMVFGEDALCVPGPL